MPDGVGLRRARAAGVGVRSVATRSSAQRRAGARGRATSDHGVRRSRSGGKDTQSHRSEAEGCEYLAGVALRAGQEPPETLERAPPPAGPTCALGGLRHGVRAPQRSGGRRPLRGPESDLCPDAHQARLLRPGPGTHGSRNAGPWNGRALRWRLLNHTDVVRRSPVSRKRTRSKRRQDEPGPSARRRRRCRECGHAGRVLVEVCLTGCCPPRAFCPVCGADR